MEKLKKQKKRIIILLVLILLVFLGLFWNKYSDEIMLEYSSETDINKIDEKTLKKEDKNLKEITNSTNDAPEKPVEVYSLGEFPFVNDEFAKFRDTSVKNLLNVKEPSIVIANKDFLKEEYKKDFIELAKSQHTIIFYDEKMTADEVVAFLDGIIPVVPLEASIPLKFQAYGVTTLNDELIPIFVSVTSDQNKLNEESFKQLFKQIVEKDK